MKVDDCATSPDGIVAASQPVSDATEGGVPRVADEPDDSATVPAGQVFESRQGVQWQAQSQRPSQPQHVAQQSQYPQNPQRPQPQYLSYNRYRVEPQSERQSQQAYQPQSQYAPTPQPQYQYLPQTQSQPQYVSGSQSQNRPQPLYPAQPQLQQQYQYAARPQSEPWLQYRPQYIPQTQSRPQPMYWVNQHMQQWLRSARKVFSAVGFAMVMVVAVWMLLQLIITSVVTAFVGPVSHLPGWATIVLGNGPLYLVAIPLSLLIFRRLPVIQRTTSRIGPARFFGLFALSFPVSFVGGLIGTGLSNLVSNGQAQNGLDKLLNRLDLGSVFVFTVILAPIFEEWLCRKLVIDRLLSYGEKLAIVVSAVIFGLLHGNLFQFFYAAGLGLILGYVYVRTGRMRYTVAMHMLFNFIGGFLPMICMSMISQKTMDALGGDSSDLLRLVRSGQVMELLPLLVLLLFRLVLTVVGVIVAIVNRKKLIFHRTPQEIPAGFRAKVALGNAGIITFAILSAILMVVSLVS